MRRALSEELKELESRVLKVSELIKDMFKNCKNYEEVMKLENLVNQSEMENEFFAIKILALYQPEARDLRSIISAIKLNNDLERIADHIENIARDYKLMGEEPTINLKELYEKVFLAYQKSITAYENKDVNLAIEVIKSDREIDNLRNALVVEIVNFISQNPQRTDPALKTLNIIQNLERIADLSTNICEDVIFLIEGKIFKHGKEV